MRQAWDAHIRYAMAWCMRAGTDGWLLGAI